MAKIGKISRRSFLTRVAGATVMTGAAGVVSAEDGQASPTATLAVMPIQSGEAAADRDNYKRERRHQASLPFHLQRQASIRHAQPRFAINHKQT